MPLIDEGRAWSAARSKLAEMLPRIEAQSGEGREAMIDIAANEILKAAVRAGELKDQD